MGPRQQYRGLPTAVVVRSSTALSDLAPWQDEPWGQNWVNDFATWCTGHSAICLILVLWLGAGGSQPRFCSLLLWGWVLAGELCSPPRPWPASPCFQKPMSPLLCLKDLLSDSLKELHRGASQKRSSPRVYHVKSFRISPWQLLFYLKGF